MSGYYDLDAIAKFYRGKRIGIVGNGPSIISTDKQGRRLGKADLSGYPYPMWTVNGGWHYHPNSVMGWQMDDVKGPSIGEHPQSDWYVSLVRNAKIPIMTSIAYDDYPATITYPLESIIAYFSIQPYFAESINYMVAMAIAMGVSEIDFMGCDYNPERAQERASTEHWCGIARACGMKLNVPPESALLKAEHSEQYYMPGFYGYNQQTFPLDWAPGSNGIASVDVSIRSQLNDHWAKNRPPPLEHFYAKRSNGVSPEIHQGEAPPNSPEPVALQG